MKVALVHDWLTGMRGGEKCLEVFCELFPGADLYTLIYDREAVSNKVVARINTDDADRPNLGIFTQQIGDDPDAAPATFCESRQRYEE